MVIDDVDSLYANRNGIRLLKCLCQTEPEKSVAWQSASRSLEREGVARVLAATEGSILDSSDYDLELRADKAFEDEPWSSE